MRFNSVQKILGIVVAFVLLSFFITLQGGPTGAIAIVSEPTLCKFDKSSDSTVLSCGCAQAAPTKKTTKLINKRSTSVLIKGDRCNFGIQRSTCTEVCKFSPQALSSLKKLGGADLIKVGSGTGIDYGTKHMTRALKGADAYVTR